MGDHQKSDSDANKQNPTHEIWETIKTFVWAIIIVLFAWTFIFQSFEVPSGSMIPTIQVGDFIWVTKYNYGYSHYSFPFSPPIFKGRIWFTPPQRGDVAVFRFTKNPSIDYIKRIVGLPGDHIQVKEGVLYINGQRVERLPEGPYQTFNEHRGIEAGMEYKESLPKVDGKGFVQYDILQKQTTGYANNTIEYDVPPGYFFAMGDNRDNSADSRFDEELGFVPMENLVGKAQYIFYSFDHRYPLWKFWLWPEQVRWERLLKGVR